jgi:radical SAM protein with 4Fe4S-binding SPASM domain
LRLSTPGLALVEPEKSGCGTCVSRSPDTSRLAEELRDIVVRAAGGQRDIGSGDHDHPGSSDLQLSLTDPLPFVAPVHRQPVDGRYVWVGVNEAALAVFDEADDALVGRLVDGEPPQRVADSTSGWEPLAAVIGTLAASGLLRGLDGYREPKAVSVGRFTRLHLTRACQLECAHCYSDSSPRVDRAGELPTSRWLQYVADFAAQGGERALFTGGEALLHEGCLDIMAAARDAGLHVTLFTNGIRVRKRAEQIAATAHQVQVSLDGPDAESNDAIRGRNTFNHISLALDALAERGVETRVGMTVVPSAWSNWVEKFEAVRQRYAAYPNVTFKLSYGIMPYGRGVSIDPEGTATKEEIDAFLADVNGDTSPQITRHNPGCGYGEQVVVAPDGHVHPCHLLDGAICHLDDMPLTQIVELLAGVARQVDVDHVEGCRTCEIRYLCGGSCRVVASRATGSRLVTNCTPTKKEQKYRNLARSFGGGARTVTAS